MRKPLNLYIEEDLADRLEAHATENGYSKSRQIEMWVKKFCKKGKKDGKARVSA